MKLFSSIAAVFVLCGCAHEMYPGIPQEVKKLDGGRPVPAWVKSTDRADRPTDGYFRIAALPDRGVTDAATACRGSSNFWNTETANYALTVEPKDFRYWTSEVRYPVYSKTTTAEQENICEGFRDYVYVLPWYPLKFAANERLLFRFKGESTQSLKLTNYMAAAAGIAGAFSGGGVVAAAASKESTQAAMVAINTLYSDVTNNMVSIGEPLDIRQEKIQSGLYDYQLPMHYFEKNESKEKIDEARRARTNVLFRVNFIVDYARSMVGVAGPNDLPRASFSSASTYLTYKLGPQEKSFLERISESYPTLLDKLRGDDANSACIQVRQFIRSSGYSPSDEGALYGALLYLASGNSNFHYSGKYSSIDCLPLDELGGAVYAVYGLQPVFRYDDEFTTISFGEPDRSRYLNLLSDMAQGIAYNDKVKASGIISPLLAPNVEFSSAGDFAGRAGVKTKEETVAELSGLNVSRLGCFMPAEHATPNAVGPRLIFSSSKPTGGSVLGMATFTFDAQRREIVKIDIRDISSPVANYLRRRGQNGSPIFATTSKCTDLIGLLPST